MKNVKSMVRVAHIYACNAKRNSGDFMIGIATKRYFSEVVLKDTSITFIDLDCRKSSLFTIEQLSYLNSFDYLLVGGGGLFLPDTEPNRISCWQWVISSDVLQKLTVPILCLSIGYNLFCDQTMEMPDRTSNRIEEGRIEIFKKHVQTLLDKALYFSLRHQEDIDDLISIVGESYRSKIQFEYCPTIWYSRTIWKPLFEPSKQKYIAIEIKDDREWRRYSKIGKERFYSELKSFVIYLQQKGVPVAYLSHDGSKNFYNYCKLQNIQLPLLDNSCADEKKIFENYNACKLILCSAGHSQMMAHGLSIPTISLVSHPKVLRFCLDTGNTRFIEINKNFNICDTLTRMIP